MADINPVLSPIATLIVGLVAAFIAFQQWNLARHKLKLDLFDRRYKVYESTRCFLLVIIREATFKDKDLFELHAGTSDATFLYSRDITSYIAAIRKSALNMRMYQRQYEPLPVGDKRSALVDREHAELMWLSDQLMMIPTVFSPYLSFANISDGFFFEELTRHERTKEKYKIL